MLARSALLRGADVYEPLGLERRLEGIEDVSYAWPHGDRFGAGGVVVQGGEAAGTRVYEW